MRTQAENFRISYGRLKVINGYQAEVLTRNPIYESDAMPHPDSNELCTGYVFPDGSILWEEANNNNYTLYTQR